MLSFVPQETSIHSPNFETILPEAMSHALLANYETDFSTDAGSLLLGLLCRPPPGLTKPGDEAPADGLGPAGHSEADTVSTASRSGDEASEHDVGSDYDWQSHDFGKGMAAYPMVDPYAGCWQKVTLPLSEDLFGLLSSRRGKQRLRALQNQSGAYAELDVNWHVPGLLLRNLTTIWIYSK